MFPQKEMQKPLFSVLKSMLLGFPSLSALVALTAFPEVDSRAAPTLGSTCAGARDDGS